MTDLPPEKRDRVGMGEPGAGRPLPPPDPTQRVGGTPDKQQGRSSKGPQGGSALPPPDPRQRARGVPRQAPRSEPGGSTGQFDKITEVRRPSHVQEETRPAADGGRVPEGPKGKQYRKHQNREAAPKYGPGRLLLRLLIVAAIWVIASLAFRFIHNPWSPSGSAGLSGSWQISEAVLSHG